jgi:PmbA protein
MSTFTSANISIQAEDEGRKGRSSESVEQRRWKDLDLPQLSQRTADRALKMIEAKPIKSQKITIIWRNKLFANILRIMFGRTLSADSIQKNRSPWIGKIRENIATKDVNLFDDGIKEGGLGTRKFDDEGFPQQRTVLIDQGILMNYLYDNYTANKEGKESTGNAHRSYRSSPVPMANNLSLREGEVTVEELIKDTRRGVYVEEVIGDWLSNPISGDLSATITNGFLIENGELTQAIKGVVISTNFFQILNDPTLLIANDTRNSGSVHSPSVKMNNLTLVGLAS